MAQALQDMKVAILVTDGFEQVELTEPRKVLEQAGAQVRVVSPANGKVKGWNHTDWGNEIPVDEPLDEAQAERYDALVLPGGVMNPDKLRRNERALSFVKGFFDERKPVAIRKEVFHSEEFRALWDRIKHRTTYRVEFDNGRFLTSVARMQLVPDEDWDDYQAEQAAKADAEAKKAEAPAEIAPAAEGGDSGESAAAPADDRMAALLARSKAARERKAAG